MTRESRARHTECFCFQMSAGCSLFLFLQELWLIVIQRGTDYRSSVTEDASVNDSKFPVTMPRFFNVPSLDFLKFCLTCNRDYSKQQCSTSCDQTLYQLQFHLHSLGFGVDMTVRSLSLFLQAGLSFHKFVGHGDYSFCLH